MDKHTRSLATALGLVAATVCAPAEAAWKPDPSFGPNGVKLLAPFPGASQSLVASAADPQGRIVAVGTLIQGGQRDLMVMRFLADGREDPGFGFGGSVSIDTGVADESALAVAVQADGSAVIAGSRGRGAMLLRLTPMGALDAGFGTNGYTVPAFMTGSAARLVDVALDSQGRAVALGTVTGDGGAARVNAFVMRTEVDGRLDRAFDLDGVRVLREFDALAAALVVGPGDRTVLVGYHGQEYRLAALTSAGSLDLGFGSGGVSRSVVGNGAIATDLVVHNNSYFVSGLNAAPLVRFNAAGFRDAGFGQGGIVRGAMPVEAWTLSPLADGTLGVGGSCRGGAGAGWYLATLAVNGTTLSTTTCEVVASGSTLAVVRSLQPDVTRLVAVGHRYDATGAASALLRFTAQASVVTPVPAPTASSPLDPRCSKPVFRRNNPLLCAPPPVVIATPTTVTPPAPVATPAPVVVPTPTPTPMPTPVAAPPRPVVVQAPPTDPRCSRPIFRRNNPSLCR